MGSGSIFRKLTKIAGAWMPWPAARDPGPRSNPEDLFRKYESLASLLGGIRTPTGDHPGSFYQEMALKLAGLFPADAVAVLAPDPADGSYQTLFTIPPEAAGRVAAATSELDAAVRKFHAGKRFLCISCPGNNRDNAPAPSCCFFPILMDGRLDAILFLMARNLSAADGEMIAGFCRQAALVIGNRKLYRSLSGRLHDAASVADAFNAFSRVQNEKELLRVILEKSAELLNAEQGSLILVDQEDQALLLKAKKGALHGLDEDARINPGEGISGRVAELGLPMLVEDLERDPRTNRQNRHNYRTRSFLSVPIRIEDRIIGVINLADKSDGASFTGEDLKIVQSIATQAAVAIDRNLLRSQIEELKKLSATDQLTGLLNRRYAFERLKDELARSKRGDREFSILMIDLDGFKRCNDLLGHLFGDYILIETAKTLLASVRSMDVVARYGGDEFLVILPETPQPVAAQIAERIRTAVDDLALCRESAETDQRLSTSIGLVSYPGQGDTLESLLAHADAALYRAKKNGKNRVEIMI